MRRAGTIREKKDAERFADYLLTEGITTRVDAESDGWAVWIIEEQHLDRSKQDLADFIADPQAERFRGRNRQADEIRRAERKRHEEYRRNVVDVRSKWRGHAGGPIPVTIALIVICLGLALFVGLADQWTRDQIVIADWLFFAPLVVHWGGGLLLSSEAFEFIAGGQVWRLITPIFMHGDMRHLLFNMVGLFILGRLVESRRGSWRYVGLVLAAAVISNCAQYVRGFYWGPFSPNVVQFLGISGVVYGLFGYAWFKSMFDPSAGIFLSPMFIAFVLISLVLCISGVIGNIANTAHIAGLATGAAIAYFPVLRRNRRR